MPGVGTSLQSHPPSKASPATVIQAGEQKDDTVSRHGPHRAPRVEVPGAGIPKGHFVREGALGGSGPMPHCTLGGDIGAVEWLPG